MAKPRDHAWPISLTVTTYTWHPQQRRWRYAFAFGAMALAVLVWLSTVVETELWPRLLASAFALGAVALLIDQDTRVDTEAHCIVREGRLFGCFRVWLRRHSLSDFTGVAMQRQSDPEGDTVFVGLRRRSGRFMAVRYFNAGTGEVSVEAERMARSLADSAGLKFSEDSL